MTGAKINIKGTASPNDAVSNSTHERFSTVAISLTEEFQRLTNQLKRALPLDKCVLVLRRDSENRLAAVATWDHGELHDGLAINLPHDGSLFEKVTEDGSLYTENFCASFSGNFFERKLLIDSDSRSFAIQPLRHEGHLVGMVGMSSEQPMAFSLLEEGELGDTLANFAASCDTVRGSI